MPRFSVVIPAYNIGSYLTGCLQSLKDQTFGDFEAIVVDDASTDDTGEIADSWAAKDSRFSVTHHEENQGLHLARRTGVAKATGDYVVPLDGDDSLAPETLERLDEALRQEPVDSLHFGVNAIAAGATGEPEVKAFEAFNNSCEGTVSQDELLREVFIDHKRDWRFTNHAYRREVLQKAFEAMATERLERAEDSYETLVFDSLASEESTHNEIRGYNYYLGRGIINYEGISREKYLHEVECARRCMDAAKAWADSSSSSLIPEAYEGLKAKLLEILVNDWGSRVKPGDRVFSAYEIARVLGKNEVATNIMRLARDRVYDLWVNGKPLESDSVPQKWANLAREVHGPKENDELWFGRYLDMRKVYFGHVKDIERRSQQQGQQEYVATAAEQPVRILVSAHREFARFDAKSLQMIQVGAALAPRHFDKMLHDDEGENDSDLNRMLCEMTAQYWAWKHVDADYIGFCHYRRYFNFSGHLYRQNLYGEIVDKSIDKESQKKYGLDDASIAAAIKGYDVITAPLQDLRIMPGPATTPLEQYAAAPKLHVEDLLLCGEIVKRQHPDYAEDVESYFNGHTSCFCNMYIMRGPIFKDYAAWVFPILEETMSHLDMSRYSVEGVRTPGHLAERLFNIYLVHAKRVGAPWKTKELQVVHFEDPSPRTVEKPLPEEITKPIVPVAFAADDNYVPMLTTTMVSMLENASKDRHYDITVLTSDISGANRKIIADTVGSYGDASLRFVDAAPYIEDRKLSTNNAHISNETYYRFLVQELLPFYNKVLYLDSDLIVTGDVAELFDTDVTDSLLAVTRDIDFLGNLNMPDGRRMKYAQDVMHMKDPYDYFQAGVLLLSTAAMRATMSTDQWLAEAGNTDYIYNDQDVLNSVCEGRVRYLDQRWNVMINCDNRFENFFSYAPADVYNDFMRAYSDPCITHYAGFQKPWNMVRCDCAQLYWSYARLTPYYEELMSKLAGNGTSTEALVLGLPRAVGENNPIRKIVDPLMPLGTRRREVAKSIGRAFRGFNQ